MFCDEKSQFPSIRFKEFTNAWEQEKLGECSKFYNGLTSVSKSDFGNMEKFIHRLFKIF